MPPQEKPSPGRFHALLDRSAAAWLILAIGLIVTLAALILSHVLVPASREALNARYAEIRQNVTARFLTDGEFTHPGDGLTLYVRELAPSGELLGLFLTDARDAEAVTTYTAEKALFARTETGPKLLMFNGLVQQIDAQTQRLSLTRFADFTYDLAGLIPQVTPTARNLVALSTAELLAADPADLAETGATRADFLYDGHNRFAQPFLAVGAALIGFAALLMGSFSRFGLWRQVGVAIVLLVMVQGVSTVATGMGLRSDKGWIWAYAAPIFGVALGGSMLWWSERPRRVRRAFA